MGTVLDALNRPEFRAGLWAGIVAFGVGLVVTLAWRSSGDRGAVPVGGLLLSAAVVVGLAETGRLPNTLVLGVAALAMAGLMADARDARPLTLAALLVPGAVLVATGGNLPPDPWLRGVVAVGIVAGAVLLSDFDTRWADWGAGPVLVPITAGGILVTVPDTEQALVLLGAALPLALLGWPLIKVSLGRSGSSAIVGLLVWTAAMGGYHRQSAVIGGIGSLGLLAVEPAAGWLAGRAGHPFDRLSGRPWAVVLMAAVHLGLVLLVSRLAGLQDSLRLGAVITVTVLAGAITAGAVATRRVGRELRRSGVRA